MEEKRVIKATTRLLKDPAIEKNEDIIKEESTILQNSEPTATTDITTAENQIFEIYSSVEAHQIEEEDYSIFLENKSQQCKNITVEENPLPSKEPLDPVSDITTDKVTSIRIPSPKKSFKNIFLEPENKCARLLWFKLKPKAVITKKSRHLLAGTSTIAIFVIALLIFSTNFSFGYDVMADGHVIATVKDSQSINKIIESVNNDLSENYGEKYEIKIEPELVPIIKVNDEFSQENQIKKEISALNSLVEEFYVINIDGKPIVASESMDNAEKMLEEVKSLHKSDETIQIAIINDISITKEVAPYDLLKSVDEGIQILDQTEKTTVTYTVEKDDNLDKIASFFDTTKESIIKLNPGIEKIEFLEIGSELTVEALIPLLTISEVQNLEYNQEIPFKTTEVVSEKFYEGDTNVTSQGKSGEKIVNANIISINGKEVKRTIVSEKVIQDPKPKVVEVGTKQTPAWHGTGTYILPTNGTISSRYGSRPRLGYHTGLDFATDSGTDVVAIDRGKVIFSGQHGNYGNLIILDHGNGITTYYAHNSKLIASEGDIVQQGQTISKVGSTGKSTGPHCHLEIRINNKPQNPANYLY